MRKNMRPHSAYSPLELNYIKKLKRFLNHIGAWPGEQFGEKVPPLNRIIRRVIPYQVFVGLVGEFIYLANNRTISFFVAGHVCINIFMTVVTVVRVSLASLETYNNIVKNFITKFHLLNFRHKGEYYDKMYKKVDKICHYFTLYQINTMLCGVIMFNLSPLFNDYRMGAFALRDRSHQNMTLDYSIYFEYPGYIQDDHFFLASFLNIIICYNCSVSNCVVDLLLSLMIFQIMGHILILMHNLENMPRPKKTINFKANFDQHQWKEIAVVVDLFDDEENLVIHKKITDMIKHHKHIVTFADKMSNFFGPMLALNFLVHLVILCILLLECTQKDPVALIRFGPLTILVFAQLAQLSVVFEVLGYLSEKLIDSVYFAPWECMNISNQKSMRLLLSRIQTPIRVTAMGVVPVGVETMQSILKKTISFFTFLQTLNE